LLPEAISALLLRMRSLPLRTRVTMSDKPLRMASSEFSKRPISSLRCDWMLWDRSPSATARARRAASFSGSMMLRGKDQAR